MGHVRNEIIRWTGRLGFRPVALLMGGVSMLLVPQLCHAQGLVPTPGASTGVASAALLEPNTAFEDRWELFLSGRLGFPTGTLRVGEFPTGPAKLGGVGTPGTLLRLDTLGVDTSEVVEGGARFHFTPRDAVRASFLYYFLEGSTTIRGASVVFNGFRTGLP
jgi:hypothetical protein